MLGSFSLIGAVAVATHLCCKGYARSLCTHKQSRLWLPCHSSSNMGYLDEHRCNSLSGRLSLAY